MIIELREYYLKPNSREQFIEIMEEHILPFLTNKKEIVFLGSFTTEEDPDKYIWIRGFKDTAHREQYYAEISEDPYWKAVITPKYEPILIREKKKVTLLKGTATSPIK